MEEFSMVMISSTFFVSSLLRETILRKRSHHIIAVKLIALYANNINCIMYNPSKGMRDTSKGLRVMNYREQ